MKTSVLLLAAAAILAVAPLNGGAIGAPSNATLTTAVAPGDLELQVFDLRAITGGVDDAYTGPLGFFPLAAPGFYTWGSDRNVRNRPSIEAVERDPRGPQRFNRDFVVEMIEIHLRSKGFDNWDEKLRIDVLPNALVARGESEMLREVRALLSWLENWCSQRIEIRAYFVEGEGGKAGVLNESECQRLLENRRVHAVHEGLVGMGQRFVIGNAIEQVYVSDYDVEVAQEAQIADPTSSVLRTGRQIEGRARLVSSDRIALDLSIDQVGNAHLRRVPTRAREVGELELPEISSARLGTHVVVPRSGGAFFRLGEDEGVLVTATSTGSGSSRLGADPAMGLFSVGFLTSFKAPFRFPIRSLLQRVGNSGTLYLDDNLDDEDFDYDEMRFVNEDTLYELLLESALQGEDDGEMMWTDGHSRIGLTGTPIEFERVGAVLNGLEDLHARNVSIEFELHEVQGASGAPGTPRMSGALTALHGTTAAFFRGREEASLYQYDVEIAQKATIADPIVAHDYGGLALNVTPIIDHAGDRVTLRIQGELSELGRRAEGEVYGAEGIGGMDLTERRSQVIQANPVLRAGKPHRIQIASNGDEGVSHVLVIRVSLPGKGL